MKKTGYSLNVECRCFCDRRSKIIIQENKSKYIAKNNDTALVEQYKVDGCLITKGIRCDYLLINSSKLKSYFIELKGSDINHAVDQIDQSIKTLGTKIVDYSINGRIVLTKAYAPALNTNKFKKLNNRIKGLKGNLRVKNTEMKEDI